MKCRICGCTEKNACVGGCSWAEPGLCSTCAEILVAIWDWALAAGPQEAGAGSSSRVVQAPAKVARLGLEAKRGLGDYLSLQDEPKGWAGPGPGPIGCG